MTRLEQIEASNARISALENELLKENENLTLLNSYTPIATSSLFILLGGITVLEDQELPNFKITLSNEQYQEGTHTSLRVVSGVVVTIKTDYFFEVEQIEVVERYLRSLGEFGIIKITK